MNTTINISLPTSMYKDAKALQKEERFTSVSELFRHALRAVLYPSGLTVNGFTPEFENMVLKSAKQPMSKDLVWKTEEDINKYFNKYIKSKKK